MIELISIEVFHVDLIAELRAGIAKQTKKYWIRPNFDLRWPVKNQKSGGFPQRAKKKFRLHGLVFLCCLG